MAPPRQAIPLAHIRKILEANRLPNGKTLTAVQREQLLAQYQATAAQQAAAAGAAPSCTPVYAAVHSPQVRSIQHAD